MKIVAGSCFQLRVAVFGRLSAILAASAIHFEANSLFIGLFCRIDAP